jgi:hypothetical protein
MARSSARIRRRIFNGATVPRRMSAGRSIAEEDLDHVDEPLAEGEPA